MWKRIFEIIKLQNIEVNELKNRIDSLIELSTLK